MSKPLIVIKAKLWTHKVYGNTYHTAKITVDGLPVGSVPFSYGSGDQYITNAIKVLVGLGYIPEDRRNESIWSISSDFNIVSLDTEVNHKKDL